MKKIPFENNKNLISETIKVYRAKGRLSQTVLAQKMGEAGVHMDQQMISRIESNARFVTDYELAGFCTVLDIPIQEVFANFKSICAK